MSGASSGVVDDPPQSQSPRRYISYRSRLPSIHTGPPPHSRPPLHVGPPIGGTSTPRKRTSHSHTTPTPPTTTTLAKNNATNETHAKSTQPNEARVIDDTLRQYDADLDAMSHEQEQRHALLESLGTSVPGLTDDADTSLRDDAPHGRHRRRGRRTSVRVPDSPIQIPSNSRPPTNRASRQNTEEEEAKDEATQRDAPTHDKLFADQPSPRPHVNNDAHHVDITDPTARPSNQDTPTKESDAVVMTPPSAVPSDSLSQSLLAVPPSHPSPHSHPTIPRRARNGVASSSVIVGANNNNPHAMSIPQPTFEDQQHQRTSENENEKEDEHDHEHHGDHDDEDDDDDRHHSDSNATHPSRRSSGVLTDESLSTRTRTWRDDDPWWIKTWSRLREYRPGYSLYLFSPTNRFRLLVQRIVHHIAFQVLVFTVIAFNLTFLALNTLVDDWSESAEIGVTILFLLEFFLKLIADGWCFDPESYVHNNWNLLDLIILIPSTLILFVGGNTRPAYVIRVWRIWRPLARLTQTSGLQRLRMAILKAFRPLMTALGLLGLFFILFALISVNLFQGKLGYRCSNDVTGTLLGHCGASHITCPNGYSCIDTKLNPYDGLQSFDNVLVAFVTLFGITTLDSWAELMYNVMDSTHWTACFFFIFVVVCNAFFVMNLAFAIIRSGFEKLMVDADVKKEERQRLKELELEQKAERERQRLRRNRHRAPGDPEEPPEEEERPWYVFEGLQNQWFETKIRLRIAWVGNHIYFNLFFFFVTFLNIGLLASEHHNQPQGWTDFLHTANIVLTGLFTIEFIIKWFTYGLIYYWLESWLNTLDFIVVLVGLLEFGLSGRDTLSVVRLVRIFRLFRILRVVKVVGRFQGITRLVNVIIGSLRDIAYTGLFLAMFMMLYATMGMYIFEEQFYQYDSISTKEVPRLSFTNFPNSIFLCFSILTLDKWIETMYNGVASTSWAAAIYFISWVIIGVYVLLNFFVAIIVSGFEVEQAKLLKAKLDHLKRKKLFLIQYKKHLQHQQQHSEDEDSLIHTPGHGGAGIGTKRLFNRFVDGGGMITRKKTAAAAAVAARAKQGHRRGSAVLISQNEMVTRPEDGASTTTTTVTLTPGHHRYGSDDALAGMKLPSKRHSSTGHSSTRKRGSDQSGASTPDQVGRHRRGSQQHSGTSFTGYETKSGRQRQILANVASVFGASVKRFKDVEMTPIVNNHNKSETDTIATQQPYSPLSPSSPSMIPTNALVSPTPLRVTSPLSPSSVANPSNGPYRSLSLQLPPSPSTPAAGLRSPSGYAYLVSPHGPASPTPLPLSTFVSSPVAAAQILSGAARPRPPITPRQATTNDFTPLVPAAPSTPRQPIHTPAPPSVPKGHTGPTKSIGSGGGWIPMPPASPSKARDGFDAIPSTRPTSIRSPRTSALLNKMPQSHSKYLPLDVDDDESTSPIPDASLSDRSSDDSPPPLDVDIDLIRSSDDETIIDDDLPIILPLPSPTVESSSNSTNQIEEEKKKDGDTTLVQSINLISPRSRRGSFTRLQSPSNNPTRHPHPPVPAGQTSHSHTQSEHILPIPRKPVTPTATAAAAASGLHPRRTRSMIPIIPKVGEAHTIQQIVAVTPTIDAATQPTIANPNLVTHDIVDDGPPILDARRSLSPHLLGELAPASKSLSRVSSTSSNGSGFGGGGGSPISGSFTPSARSAFRSTRSNGGGGGGGKSLSPRGSISVPTLRDSNDVSSTPILTFTMNQLRPPSSQKQSPITSPTDTPTLSHSPSARASPPPPPPNEPPHIPPPPLRRAAHSARDLLSHAHSPPPRHSGGRSPASPVSPDFVGSLRPAPLLRGGSSSLLTVEEDRSDTATRAPLKMIAMPRAATPTSAAVNNARKGILKPVASGSSTPTKMNSPSIDNMLKRGGSTGRLFDLHTARTNSPLLNGGGAGSGRLTPATPQIDLKDSLSSPTVTGVVSSADPLSPAPSSSTPASTFIRPPMMRSSSKVVVFADQKTEPTTTSTTTTTTTTPSTTTNQIIPATTTTTTTLPQTNNEVIPNIATQPSTNVTSVPRDSPIGVDLHGLVDDDPYDRVVDVDSDDSDLGTGVSDHGDGDGDSYSSSDDKPIWQIELEREIAADEAAARRALLPKPPPKAIWRILSFRRAEPWKEPRRPVSYIPDIYYKDHHLASRQWFRTLSHGVFHPNFEYAIIFVVLLSSLSLALDSHSLDKSQGFGHVLWILDNTFLGIFILEMCLKILCMGIYGMPDAYLGDHWNKLDFAIVITNTLYLTIDTGRFSALRSLRVLRPLRLINKSGGMRAVVNTILRCFFPMFNVWFLLFLAYLTFGILGVRLWSGEMGYCQIYTDEASQTLATSLGLTDEIVYKLDKVDCLSNTYNGTTHWSTPRKNFDNILNAFISLYSISTMQNWSNLCFAVMDITSSETAPSQNETPVYALYFVAFIFLVPWVLNGLFIGVVFDTFIGLRDESSGLGLLSDSQKLWVQSQMKLLDSQPMVRTQVPYHSTLRTWCHRVIHHRMFEGFIVTCVCVNIFTMSINYVDQASSLIEFREVTNLIFIIVYFLEMLLKLVTFYPRLYFRDRWNQFDCIIVIGSIFEVLFTYTGSSSLEDLIMILKLFRMFRVFRVIKGLKRVRVLLRSLFLSLPKIGNVAFLLLFIFFVFSIVAVELFGDIMVGQCLTHDDIGFETFQLAMLTLFRISTGQDWDCIMYDCMDEANGGTPFAVIYFFFFLLGVNFICLSLFIAVLLDNLSSAFHHSSIAEARSERRRLMLNFQKQQQSIELETVKAEYISKRTIQQERRERREARKMKKIQAKLKHQGVMNGGGGGVGVGSGVGVIGRRGSSIMTGIHIRDGGAVSPHSPRHARRHGSNPPLVAGSVVVGGHTRSPSAGAGAGVGVMTDADRIEMKKLLASTHRRQILHQRRQARKNAGMKIKTDRELLDHLQLSEHGTAFMETLIGEFIEQWEILDPNETRFIPVTKLPELMRRLDTPIGVGPQGSLYKMIVRCAGVTLRKHRFPPSTRFIRAVHFTELLHGLLHYLFGADVPDGLTDVTHEIHGKLEELIGVKVEEVIERDPLSTAGVWLACQAMEQLWQKHKKRREDEKAARDGKGKGKHRRRSSAFNIPNLNQPSEPFTAGAVQPTPATTHTVADTPLTPAAPEPAPAVPLPALTESNPKDADEAKNP